MTELSVELSGLDTVDASVAAVIEALRDPQTATDAAQLVATAARPGIPRDTSKLANSERVDQLGTGAQLVYAARHAPIVHARHPWLGAAITRAVPQVEQLYEERVREQWD